MQYIGSLEAAKKHISAEICTENLHNTVKILEICMDLQDLVQRSLHNPAEKILQICTGSQRSKTWVGTIKLCRTFKNYFGQFAWIEKKSQYNSRVSLHEAPTKNE